MAATSLPTPEPTGNPIWTLVVPGWIPLSLNQIKHWSTKHRARNDSAALFAYYTLQSGIPIIRPGIYLPRRRVTMHVEKPGKPFDPDNILKVTLDALKQARLIVDDSAQWLEMQVPIITHSKKRQTVFTFQDIDTVLPIV